MGKSENMFLRDNALYRDMQCLFVFGNEKPSCVRRL